MSDLDLSSLPTYNRSQLAQKNGQDSVQIWIAYNGLIYDVTESRLFAGGKHYQHWAGQDLTSELKDAPHTDRVFKRFTPIGRLLT